MRSAPFCLYVVNWKRIFDFLLVESIKVAGKMSDADARHNNVIGAYHRREQGLRHPC